MNSPKPRTRNAIGWIALRSMPLIVFITLASVTAKAQEPVHSNSAYGNTPLGMTQGAPAGSYPLSGFESVNPYNGALNFRLPLLHVGGRGSVQHVITLAVEHHWSVDKDKNSTPGYTYSPNENRWTTFDPGFSPGAMIGRRTGIDQIMGILVYCPDNGEALTRLTFTAPDGTEFEFRDAQTNGALATNAYVTAPAPTYCQLPQQAYSRGRVFVTGDGSAATFISDGNVYEHSDSGDPFSFSQQLIYPSGYMYLRDGTCYRIDFGKVIWIRDRNGNRMSFVYGPAGVTSITDSLNRVVTIAYQLHDDTLNRDYDQISFKGFGGATRLIKIWYRKLKNVLRSDFGTEAKTYKYLFPSLSGSLENPYTPRVVSAIELPDGRQYLLSYNWYGELARVDLPTGGRFEYDYDVGVTGGDPTNGGVISGSGTSHIYRRVVQRRIYTDSGPTAQLTEIYSQPEDVVTGNAGFVQVKHKSGGAVIARDKHYYTGSAKDSFFREPYEFAKWQDGKETKTEYYDAGDAPALLRTVVNTWQQPIGNNTWPLSGSGETDPAAKPNQPQITSTTTTLNDTGDVSKQTFAYDQYTNRTEVDEYDFGNPNPGSLVRKTITSFLVDNVVNSQTVHYTTVNPNITSPDPALTVHIRSLPLEESVYEGSSRKARSTYEYDNYTDGLTNRSDIAGHDLTAPGAPQPIHNSSYLTRGNSTQVTHWVLGSPDLGLSTRMQYDIAGNAVISTDPRSNTTTFDFSDRFGTPNDEAQSNTVPSELANPSRMAYAFATKVTNALGQTAYTQYDYYLGMPVNSEDANGVVNKGRYAGFEDGTYTDALDRPTELVVSVNGGSAARRTRFTYNDASKIITTESDQTNLNDGVSKSESLYDGLGRTYETHAYESATDFITTKQEFDALGRVSRSYNPYRTTGDSTYGYATTNYDGLGRVLTVTTSDNAQITTTYSGKATTVTDQATNQRRSITDGLGRLIRVDEPTTQGLGTVTSPNQPTSYAYDVLNNLVTVTQGGQTRRFAYDSLSRLIYAANPEQTTSSALTFNSQQWAVKYDYDGDSNLTAKTESRVNAQGQLLQVNYTYDALNRVTTRTYLNDTGGTPSVTYSYDSTNVVYSKGRLTTVATSVSSNDYLEYDALGRVIKSRQTTASVSSPPYDFTYGYDRAGNMISETYPSGKTLTIGYDAAGRMAGVKNQAAGTYYVGAAVTDTTNRIQYAAQGAVSAMKIGNGLWEHTDYNTRLQPKQIGLGTASSGANSTSVLGLDYDYGTTLNNGNLLKETISAPGAPAMTAYQCYTYDSLNRLSTAQERSATNCTGTQIWSQNFGYDRFGNRTSLTGSGVTIIPPPTVDPATNRFQSGYVYDNAGNVTNDGLGNQYQYDAENHQTSHVRTGTGGTSTNYLYDGDGHRVIKAVTPVGGVTTTTVFVYNVEGQLIAEYSDPMPAREGGTKYLTADHLGSTRVVTGSDGTVKARHDYLPFGEDIGLIGGRGNVTGYSASDSTRQKFTQKERDNESGLDYFLARYYSSAQGRFTSADEFIGGPDELFDFSGAASSNPTFYADLTDPQSLNKYQYCYNNPLLYIDPDGHQGVRKWIQDTLRGAAAAFNSDNGLPTPSGDQTTTGRTIGHLAAITQGVTEVVTGGNMIVGGVPRQ